MNGASANRAKNTGFIKYTYHSSESGFGHKQAKILMLFISTPTLKNSDGTMLGKIIAGKGVLFIAPAPNDVVDEFSMPDIRPVNLHGSVCMF